MLTGPQLDDGVSTIVGSCDAGAEGSYFEGIFFPEFFALVQSEPCPESEELSVLESVGGVLSFGAAGTREPYKSPLDINVERTVDSKTFLGICVKTRARDRPDFPICSIVGHARGILVVGVEEGDEILECIGLVWRRFLRRQLVAFFTLGFDAVDSDRRNGAPGSPSRGQRL